MNAPIANPDANGGCLKRVVRADELLSSDWPMKYASASNGTDEGYDGSCPCGLIHGEGFEVEVHCWRSGCQHGCQYSGIHVSGTLDENTLRKIGEHIRENNGWTNHTDWNVTASPNTMNNKIKIPKGWRKLKVGEFVKKGDKVLDSQGAFNCWATIGLKVSALDQEKNPFVRKIKSPKRKPSIQIPSGYKKLANGTIIKVGDLFYHPDDREWYPTMADGLKVIPHFVYVRKN